ncbi:PREDICTED: RNA-binding protein 42-like isoform X2 [Ipomoea nil]|uniref:RNA-binding protein 42-like isoform X2 n=1 Tax=Ipomoea nil TaxID=35883 RepID=UPI000900B6D1|nr:PREDICTED: RNA-binding protein 42-like isoform X2 [Ipomoea nil]
MSTVPLTPAATGSSFSQYNYANGTYFPTPFHLQQPPQPYIGAAAVYPAPVPLPGTPLAQYQQAQQLFQRVAQTITPEALQNVKAALASSEIEHKAEAKKKAVPRKAAGQTWEDPTLADWPENDHRLFCGDLGNEVNDDVLSKAFSRFPSFNMARMFVSSAWSPQMSRAISSQVVRDKRTGKTKGYGFVSFSNPSDLAAALKEMNGKYVGNRPIKLRKSRWQDRIDYEALERQKNQSQKKAKLPKKSVLHK